MAKILWDTTATRLFEIGIDRGVLYLPSGTAVAWNGLRSIQEDTNDRSTSAVFFDGEKYMDAPGFGDYSAKIKAITYPDEFLECEGVNEFDTGMYVDNQNSKTFDMCYRTLVGNDVAGTSLGYRIHILYNLTASPDTSQFDSLSDDFDLTEFGWDVTSRPEFITGYRPTSHVIVDSRYLDPDLLFQLENTLYGTVSTAPSLPSLAALAATIAGFGVIIITDNGDGTWTADAPAEFLTMTDATTFQITGVTATYSDANTYTVSTT